MNKPIEPIARPIERTDADTKPTIETLREALRELIAAREALAAFREHEWVRVDWQGLCSFRRAVGCPGTDGCVSAMGTPRPVAHADDCPFSRLAQTATPEPR